MSKFGTLGTRQKQKHPFRELVLSQCISEQACVEAFWAKITLPSQAIAAASPGASPAVLVGRLSLLDVEFTSRGLGSPLASCARTSSSVPDGITYSTLTHLATKAKKQLLHFYNIS